MNDKAAKTCKKFCVVYSEEVELVASDAFLVLFLTHVTKNACVNS